MKLPISLGILSWKSNKSIKNTIKSLKNKGLLTAFEQVHILFQECSQVDIEFANEHNILYIGLSDNIGIGKGFEELARASSQRFILLLEHDWELVENQSFAINHLAASIDMLEKGYDCVRLRHRLKYGFPHYSVDRYKGNELEFFDDWIQLSHPHLIDSVHWRVAPDLDWPDKIQKTGDFFVCNSRYANWTNNPCLYKRDFYLDVVRNFTGHGLDLERNISYWWSRQPFRVAQGKGLFRHMDLDKYPSSKLKLFVKSILGCKYF